MIVIIGVLSEPEVLQLGVIIMRAECMRCGWGLHNVQAANIMLALLKA